MRKTEVRKIKPRKSYQLTSFQIVPEASANLPEEQGIVLNTKDMMSDVTEVINNWERTAYGDSVNMEQEIEEGDVEISASNNHEIVYFDLETTGFSIKTDEITQIAAQCDKQQPFNVYIKPVFGISKEVEKVTGLSVRNGEMLLHGKKVKTTPLSIALLMFIQFLRNIGKRVILVAHNGFRFDARFLMRIIHYNGFWNEFEASVIGFADTLPIFKEKLPDRKKTKRKFNQTDLGIDFLGKDAVIGLHNALKDIELLIKLLKVVGVTQEDVKSNAKSLNTIIQEHNKAEQTAENKATMDCLKGAISDGMITRIAKEGINFTCLQLAYETGEGAIEDMLSEDIDGRPRVTKTKKILNNLCMRMAELNNH